MKRAWRETSAATKWQKCNRSAQKLTVAAAVTTTTTPARVIPEMATEWPKKRRKKTEEGEGKREEKAFRVSCKKPFNACCILLGYACSCLCMGK